MVQTGKFQVYYKRVKSELEDIQASNNYMSLSKAFAHWYLLNFLDIDAHELGEIVIDGDGQHQAKYLKDLVKENMVVGIEIIKNSK